MKNEKQYSISELKQQIKSEMTGMTNSDRAGIAKVIQLNLLKELSINLKAFDSISEKQWKKTITKLKNYKKYIKIDGDNFVKFINILLPLLGAYLGCMFTFKKNKENSIEAGVPLIKKPNTNEYTETSEEVVEATKKLIPADPSSISYIPDWCNGSTNAFHAFSRSSNLPSWSKQKTNKEKIK